MFISEHCAALKGSGRGKNGSSYNWKYRFYFFISSAVYTHLHGSKSIEHHEIYFRVNMHRLALYKGAMLYAITWESAPLNTLGHFKINNMPRHAL